MDLNENLKKNSPLLKSIILIIIEFYFKIYRKQVNLFEFFVFVFIASIRVESI